ncbi:MAG: transposase, partial [Thermoproteales archaeon]|nr:transposase [Thermoproteales archaeon]
TGFSPKIGFIHVDLRPLITVRIVYQEKRSKAQEIASKKLRRGRELLEKYSHREKNKCRDIERKIAIQLIRLFPNTMHGFERLNKENMIRKNRKRSKKLRKRVARVSWRNIVREIKQRAIVKEVNPKDTSKTCSRCGFKVKDLRGQVFKCPKCGLIIDRQKNACINIYLRMRGFPHSYESWERFVKPLLNHELWVGVALRGRMPMIWSPMKGDLRAVKPKGLVDQRLLTSMKVYQT